MSKSIATCFLDTYLDHLASMTIATIVLMVMDKERYQQDQSHLATFQLYRARTLACLADGSHSPTWMPRATPIGYAKKEIHLTNHTDF